MESPSGDQVHGAVLELNNVSGGKAVGITEIVNQLRRQQNEGERPFSKAGVRRVLIELVESGYCESTRRGFYRSSEAIPPASRIQTRRKVGSVRSSISVSGASRTVRRGTGPKRGRKGVSRTRSISAGVSSRRRSRSRSRQVLNRSISRTVRPKKSPKRTRRETSSMVPAGGAPSKTRSRSAAPKGRRPGSKTRRESLSPTPKARTKSRVGMKRGRSPKLAQSPGAMVSDLEESVLLVKKGPSKKTKKAPRSRSRLSMTRDEGNRSPSIKKRSPFKKRSPIRKRSPSKAKGRKQTKKGLSPSSSGNARGKRQSTKVKKSRVQAKMKKSARTKSGTKKAASYSLIQGDDFQQPVSNPN